MRRKRRLELHTYDFGIRTTVIPWNVLKKMGNMKREINFLKHELVKLNFILDQAITIREELLKEKAK